MLNGIGVNASLRSIRHSISVIFSFCLNKDWTLFRLIHGCLSPCSDVILFAGSSFKQYYNNVTNALTYLYETNKIFIIFPSDCLSDSKLFVRNINVECRFLASDNSIIFVKKIFLFPAGVDHLFGWHS